MAGSIPNDRRLFCYWRVPDQHFAEAAHSRPTRRADVLTLLSAVLRVSPFIRTIFLLNNPALLLN